MRKTHTTTHWAIARIEIDRPKKGCITSRRVSIYTDEESAHAAASRLADKNRAAIQRGRLDYIVEPVKPGDRMGRRKAVYCF